MAENTSLSNDPMGETNREKALRGEVVHVTDDRLREMRQQAIQFEGVGDRDYHWHWAAAITDLIERRAQIEAIHAAIRPGMCCDGYEPCKLCAALGYT